MPGFAIFWNQIYYVISWQTIFAGEPWYESIGGESMVYTGKLVGKQWYEGEIYIDPSEGVAWVREDWGEYHQGLVTAHRFWPYELEREGSAPIPIFAMEGSQKLSVLKRYVGYTVDIRGKLRKPQITMGDKNYTIQDVLELVPGNIRESSE